MGKTDHLPKYKKGQSGNPKGRPPDMLGKAMRQLTAEEFREIANMIIKGSIDQLKAMSTSKDSSALKVMIAATVVKIISRGDMHALDILLNRLVGKVKDQIEMTGRDGGPQVILTMPRNFKEAENPGENNVSNRKA